MSNKKISELPVATAINATDLSVLVSSGADYQFAFSTLLQFISSGLTLGANVTFGTTLPQNTSGKNGDVFINTSAGSFAQKAAGVWTVMYTLPTNTGGTADGTLLYGSGIPGSSTGSDNDTYINTATGIFYKRSGGSWSQVFSMQTGPAGPQGTAGTNGTNGTNGKTILNGATNPSNLTTGTDGDFYINTSTFTFFGPKTSGVWPAGTSLAGANGATGAGVPTGGTAGQVLSKVDGSDFNTHWVTASGGGGSVSGLTPKELLFGGTDGTIQQDSDLQFDLSTKSLYKNVDEAPAGGGNIILIGDSITAGGGASPNTLRYSLLLANLLGLNEVNIGRNGTTLGNPALASSSLVNNLSLIPPKSVNDKYLLFNYGANDIDQSTTYLDSDFSSDYTTVLNNALSKGWAKNEILITTVVFINSDNPPTRQTSADFTARQASFNDAIRTVANTFDITLLDINTLMLNNGTDYLSADGLHPNNWGHALIANFIYGKLISDLVKNGQALAINGLTQLKHLNLPNADLISDGEGNLLGRKSDGSIGVLFSLPPNIRFAGDTYLGGKVVQPKFILPNGITPTDLDFLLRYHARIISCYGSDTQYYTMIEPADNGMNMNLRCGPSAGEINFFTNGNDLVMTVKRINKLLEIQGDLYQATLGSKIYSDYSGIEAGFVPFKGTAETSIFNQHNGGSFGIYMSNGIDYGALQMLKINSKGRFIIQNGNDFTDFSDVACAKLALNSTSEGFLIPRMTTIQRDSLATITSINMVSYGSGYTTASVVLTPAVTGFAATCNIEGGQIQSVTITDHGTGVLSLPTISFSGDGIDATASVSMNLVEGLQIYNLDTHKINFYDGSDWQQTSTTIA
ncbi:MAG: SGNH/GDSL hydrolase family protein [Mucilaginibacter sp.]